MSIQTFAEQRDEVNAGLAEQAPAELLEGFGRIRADQAAVDYAARAPKVGDRAPGFTLPDQLGRQVSLLGELQQGPVVLIFYRGEWCPYCNALLRTYGLRAADFSQRDARLLAVSPQTPDNSLTMAEKHSLECPVLSDEGGEVIGSYGLKYDVPRTSCTRPVAPTCRSSMARAAGSCPLRPCSWSTARGSFAS